MRIEVYNRCSDFTSYRAARAVDQGRIVAVAQDKALAALMATNVEPFQIPVKNGRRTLATFTGNESRGTSDGCTADKRWLPA